MKQEKTEFSQPSGEDLFLIDPLMAGNGSRKNTGGSRKPGRNLLIGVVIFFLLNPLFRSSPSDTFQKSKEESDLICYEHLILGNHLPQLEDPHGQVSSDTPYRLHLSFLGMDQKRYDDYLHRCRSSGFQEDNHQPPGKLRLFNQEGFGLTFSYIEPQDKLYVTLNAPYDFAPLSWPSKLIGDLIPDPQAEEGFISHLSSGQMDIYLKDMTPARFLAYQRAAEAAGFDQNIQKSKGYFIAENANQSKLYLTDEGGDTLRLALQIAEPDRLVP